MHGFWGHNLRSRCGPQMLATIKAPLKGVARFSLDRDHSGTDTAWIEVHLSCGAGNGDSWRLIYPRRSSQDRWRKPDRSHRKEWAGLQDLPTGSTVDEVASSPSAIGWRERLYAAYSSTHSGHRENTAPDAAMKRAAYFDANVARHLPVDQAAPVLDLACGAGPFVAYLRDRGHTQVYGIDLSGEQVELARSRGLDMVERAEALQYLCDKPGQFGAITAFDLFEHLTRPELFDLLNAIHRALRPGGRLIVQTVNGGSPFHGLIRYGDLTHETAYTPSSLAQAFRVAGFGNMNFHEIVIPVYGLKSSVRRRLWPLVRTLHLASLSVESGGVGGVILTQNLIATADR